MGVIYVLCSKINYHVIHLNVSKNRHVMSVADQIRFARNITTWKEKMPAFYHGHQSFIDFNKLGFEHKPLYINIVRKPLERLVSYYYFLRHGDDFRPRKKRARQGNQEVSSHFFVLVSLMKYKNCCIQFLFRALINAF